MNLKETVISSFFLHLILVLLVAAVTSYTGRLSGSFPNVIALELASEETKGLPSAPVEEPQTAATPPDLGTVVQDQEVETPPEEATQPEPEQKTEPAQPPEPATAEKAVQSPVHSGGFNSLEAYYQFVMLHRQLFGQKAGARVNELLGEALKTNTRVFYGGNGIVSLFFGPDGKVSKTMVESASPDFKSFLEEISWATIPPPSTFSLGFARVDIEFTVLEGYMNYRINTF